MLENLGNVLRTGVPVTALYGALSAIFYVVISANVSRVRGKFEIFLDPGKPVPEDLHRAQRAHGNAAEYLPLGILLLLVLELSGGGSTALHVIGGLFLVARIAHAVGVLSRIQAAQLVGILGTWLILLAEPIYLLVLRFR